MNHHLYQHADSDPPCACDFPQVSIQYPHECMRCKKLLPTVSQTPRTDQHLVEAGECYHTAEMVHADFARQLERELAVLQDWKDQQMQVESEWDPQALAKALGGTIGQSCRKVIQEGAYRLIKERDAALAKCQQLREAIAYELKLSKIADEAYGNKDSSDRTIRLESALSTPPPPMVYAEVAEGLAVALMAYRTALEDGPENCSYMEYEAVDEVAAKALAAYRERFPREEQP